MTGLGTGHTGYKGPNVDLLVPVYKAQRFLPRLQHQLAQLQPHFARVFVYDDASPDDTFIAFDRAGFAPSRGVRNLGPGGARNALAAQSTSEWIHFHDVDDEIAPDYLSHVLPLLTNDTDIVIHDVAFVDEPTRTPEIVFRAQSELDTDPVRSLLINPMGTTSSVIRRELFLRIGGFDEGHRCFEDGDMHLRLALAGARVRRLPIVLETSLRHGEGASTDMAYCHRCRLSFLERYAGLLPNRLTDDLSAEFLKTAFALLSYRDKVLARRAIDSCRALGGAFPRTRSRALKLAAALLPDLAVLQLQEGVRHFASRIAQLPPVRKRDSGVVSGSAG